MHIEENYNQSSKVYKPVNNVDSFHNQTFFQHNYLKSIMNNQQITNEELTSLLKKVQQIVLTTQKQQAENMNSIENKLVNQETITTDLLNQISSHNTEAEFLKNQFLSLDSVSQETKGMLEKEILINSAILDQISFQEQSISALTNKMDDFRFVATDMNNRLDRTEEIHEEISKQLDLQEVFHQSILEKMDNTDGNISKISRQLDILKGILFERVNYLAERLEANIKIISSPVQRFFLKIDEKENKKKQ